MRRQTRNTQQCRGSFSLLCGCMNSCMQASFNMCSHWCCVCQLFIHTVNVCCFPAVGFAQTVGISQYQNARYFFMLSLYSRDTRQTCAGMLLLWPVICAPSFSDLQIRYLVLRSHFLPVVSCGHQASLVLKVHCRSVSVELMSTVEAVLDQLRVSDLLLKQSEFLLHIDLLLRTCYCISSQTVNSSRVKADPSQWPLSKAVGWWMRKWHSFKCPDLSYH